MTSLKVTVGTALKHLETSASKNNPVKIRAKDSNCHYSKGKYAN